MKISHWIGVGACAAAAMWVGGQLASSAPAPAPATPTLPWGQPSDMVGWEEFVQVTAPAGNTSGQPKVEFETWASDDDIYGASPPQWPTVNALKVLQPSALGHAVMLGVHLPRPNVFVFTPNSCATPAGLPVANGGNGAADGSKFPTDACIGEEVRRNWASFQYIVANNLYTQKGLAAAYAKHLKVDMPADSVEVKGDWAAVSDVARWLKVTPDVIRAHYYTSMAVNGSKQMEVALLSFHFSTKQTKNWVWSDFENSMNPGRCDVIGCADSVGAVTTNVRPHSVPYQSYGECRKTAAVESMMENAGIAAVWRNYCMKGSQIAFVDAHGRATLLGNSIIEPLNAGIPIKVSSCITCHAYASFGADGKPNFYALQDKFHSPTGNVDPQHMQNYQGNDFIWGLLFAQ